MISVLLPCYSRQEQLDIVLPLILKQQDVEMEVVLGIGPGITYQSDPRIKVVSLDSDQCRAGAMSAFMNKVLYAASGDVAMYVHCDMAIPCPTALKQMQDKLTDKNVVMLNYRAGDVHSGCGYTQLLMVKMDHARAAGPWDEDYGPGAAYEDADYLTRLFNLGLVIDQVFTYGEDEAWHVDHPCVRDTPDFWERYRKNKRIYHRKYGVGCMDALNAGIMNGKPFKA